MIFKNNKINLLKRETSPMRVLHISNYEKKGGAETVFSITSRNPYQTNFSGYYQSDVNSKSADIPFHSWENDNLIKGIVNYIFSLKNYNSLSVFLKNNKVDVIHLQGFFSSLSPSILLALKRAKSEHSVKIIQTLHEFSLICPNASLYNFTKNRICEMCLGHNYKLKIFTQNCDRRGRSFSIIKGFRSFLSNNVLNHKSVVDIFICPSEFLMGKLLEDGVSKSKTRLIRNPVNISFSNSQVEKKNIICYFGRFSNEKNLVFLIRTFSKWKKEYPSDFKLLLIGEGEEKQNIVNEVRASKFREEITIKPFVPQEALIKEIQPCKYFSLTSSCYENSPMTIIEAAALGIIPIVPNIGGMKESIELLVQIGSTYTPHDSDSWISCVNDLEAKYSFESKKIETLTNSLLKVLTTEKYYCRLNKLYLELTK